jgi:hypothetical protein
MRIAFEIVPDGIERGVNDCDLPYPSLDKDKMGLARAPGDSLILGGRMDCTYALVVLRLSRGNNASDAERDSGNDNQHLLPVHGNLLVFGAHFRDTYGGF